MTDETTPPAPKPRGRARASARKPKAEHRPNGRRTKLTKERQEKIVAILKLGCTEKTAWSAAGVGKSTFHQWMQKGEALPVGHHLRDFHDAVLAAHDVGEVARVQRISKAARNDPQFDTWILTHSPVYREKWSPRQKVEHGGNIGFDLRDLDEIKKAQLANKQGPAPASTAVE